MAAISKGHSTTADARDAVRDVARQLNASDADAVVLFVSSHYDRARLEAAFAEDFRCQVYGCSTSGEIGSLGYSLNGISGVAFRDNKTAIHATLLTELRKRSLMELVSHFDGARKFVHKWTKRIVSRRSCFGICLIDGLSRSEEGFMVAASEALPNVALVGGSAGDDLAFRETHIIHEGKFYTDAALLLTFATSLDFFPFRSQHFVASEQTLTVTRADPASRRIIEFDGRPAAEHYARQLGIKVSDLCAEAFSRNPLVITRDEESFVVSLLSAESDMSLVLYSALRTGDSVRLGRALDYVSCLRESLSSAANCVPNSEVTICFECILRRIEVQQKNLEIVTGTLFAEHGCVGFHTYGEQYGRNHINQTLTGIILGESR